MFSHTLKNHSFFLLLLAVLILAASSAIAQDKIAQVGVANVSVTASATSDRVRFAAPSAVVQLRLEVYDSAGQKLTDSEQRGGNVLDWHLLGGNGERVADGTYLFVVTIKNLSGRLSQKLGSIIVSAQSTSLRAATVTDLNAQQAQAVGPIESGEEGLSVIAAGDAQPVTVLANNAEESQLARTRGALTFRVGDFFSGNDQEQMRLTEAGDLGLGTSSPRAKLDVAGTIRAERFLVVKPKLAGGDKTASITLAADSSDSVQPLTTGLGTQDRIAKWIDNSGQLGSSVITETVGGNVGIGTTTPGATLEAYKLAGLNTNGGGVLVSRFNDGAGTFRGGAIYSRFISAVNDDALVFGVTSTGTKNPFSDFDQARMAVLASGNVGIGTTTPGASLDIFKSAGTDVTAGGLLLSRYNDGAGTFRGGAIYSRYISAAHDDALVFAVTGSGTKNPFADFDQARMVILANGNVGIGTTSPIGTFEVHSTSSSGIPPFSSATDGFVITNANRLGGMRIGWDDTHAGFYQQAFRTDNNAVFPILLNPLGGNVGIGTTNPNSLLDVAGNINVTGNAVISGNIAAKYQDIAEWVQAREPITASTVVSLDSTRVNTVVPSARPYDTHVAGVISSQPGVTLGQGGPGKVLVATSGRVKVRVDATRYPIRIGDLLVTSDKPGVAMKSRPFKVGRRFIHQPGTIIGKALEGLPSGKGEILVLLSLQ